MSFRGSPQMQSNGRLAFGALVQSAFYYYKHTTFAFRRDTPNQGDHLAEVQILAKPSVYAK